MNYKLTAAIIAATVSISCVDSLAGGARAIPRAQIQIPPVNPASFTTPKDNPYFPKAIGRTYIYAESDDEETVYVAFMVLPETKVIQGVTCTVIHDVVFTLVEDLGVVILEDTVDWHAWDNDGNVWYFGEDTIEYDYDDDWNVIGSSKQGSWESGVSNAAAGIVMLASPRPGTSYQQELAPGVAEDMAKVLTLNATVDIDYGTFTRCLVTKEWNPLGSPGSAELKYYARGIGNVQVRGIGRSAGSVEELIAIY